MNFLNINQIFAFDYYLLLPIIGRYLIKYSFVENSKLMSLIKVICLIILIMIPNLKSRIYNCENSKDKDGKNIFTIFNFKQFYKSFITSLYQASIPNFIMLVINILLLVPFPPLKILYISYTPKY